MQALGWIDYILIGVVAASALISLLRGFLREAVALAGWVAAVWLALTFTEPVAALFSEQVGVPSVRLGLACLLLFAGALIASGIIVWLVGLVVDKTGLSGTDRMLGVVFGAARGVIVAALLVLLAGLTPLPRDPWWREARLLPHFQRVAEQMRSLLPETVASAIDFAQRAPAAPLPGAAPGTPAPEAVPGVPVLNPQGSG